MNNEEIRKEISRLGKWYQRVKLNDVWTTERKSSTPGLWKQVNEILPNDLSGKRILDLGCNAGHYSCNAALNGASVIAMNSDTPNVRGQAALLKRYFEEKHNTKLDITYIWETIEDVALDSLGHFDYVFALAVLYYVGVRDFEVGSQEIFEYRKKVISKIKTDKFIVRTRASRLTNVAFHDKFFSDLGFKRTYGKQKGSRGLVLYERETTQN